MNDYQAKIDLLSEMIAFAVIDNELHDKEYDFIALVASELEIDKSTLHSLFSQNRKTSVIKDEFSRICQFYRLALLMHSDGSIHQNEHVRINELGILMGLSPQAIKRVLNLMQQSPNQMLSAEVLVNAFREQLN